MHLNAAANTFECVCENGAQVPKNRLNERLRDLISNDGFVTSGATNEDFVVMDTDDSDTDSDSTDTDSDL